MTTRTIARFVGSVLIALFSNGVNAGAVVLDFESISPDAYFENRTVAGFRISPNCHFDITGLTPGNKALGFDTSGCGGNHFNPNYLGADHSNSDVYIDLFGLLFDLKSLDVWGEEGTTIRSSKGGVLTSPSPSGALVKLFATGDEWSDIQWIEISGGCGGTPCRLIDNVAFDVSSPGTLPLVAISGLMLVLVRHRRFGMRGSRS